METVGGGISVRHVGFPLPLVMYDNDVCTVTLGGIEPKFLFVVRLSPNHRPSHFNVVCVVSRSFGNVGSTLKAVNRHITGFLSAMWLWRDMNWLSSVEQGTIIMTEHLWVLSLKCKDFFFDRWRTEASKGITGWHVMFLLFSSWFHRLNTDCVHHAALVINVHVNYLFITPHKPKCFSVCLRGLLCAAGSGGVTHAVCLTACLRQTASVDKNSLAKINQSFKL